MSLFRFYCPRCKQRMSCDESDRGRLIDCPTCSSSLFVPHGRESVIATPADDKDYQLLAETSPDLDPSGPEFELARSARVANRARRIEYTVCMAAGIIIPLIFIVYHAPRFKQILSVMPSLGTQKRAAKPHTTNKPRPTAQTEISSQTWDAMPGDPVTIHADPFKVSPFNVMLTNDQRIRLYPCPSDRWNSSPNRWKDVDFRGHTVEKKTSEGRPCLELSYRVGNSPPKPVRMGEVVTGPGKLYLFSSDSLDKNGNPKDNTGSVRVKILLAH